MVSSSSTATTAITAATTDVVGSDFSNHESKGGRNSVDKAHKGHQINDPGLSFSFFAVLNQTFHTPCKHIHWYYPTTHLYTTHRYTTHVYITHDYTTHP